MSRFESRMRGSRISRNAKKAKSLPNDPAEKMGMPWPTTVRTTVNSHHAISRTAKLEITRAVRLG